MKNRIACHTLETKEWFGPPVPSMPRQKGWDGDCRTAGVKRLQYFDIFGCFFLKHFMAYRPYGHA